ncbi:MAG: hypothetical protein ACE5Z5_08395 [Candidatus Bathyarchaeia archaeon]
MPPRERKRFQETARKAADMLDVRGWTVSFRSPVEASVEIGGKIYVDPTSTTLNLSDEGLTGLFLHEFGHSHHKMLNKEAKQKLLSRASKKQFGLWAVKILEDLFLNDLLYSRGLSRFLISTDLEGLRMLRRVSVERFDGLDDEQRFVLILSLIGSYLDGMRYGSRELVDLVKSRLEWFPDYITEAVFRSYDAIKDTPVINDVSEANRIDVVEIEKNLIDRWEEAFFRPPREKPAHAINYKSRDIT